MTMRIPGTFVWVIYMYTVLYSQSTIYPCIVTIYFTMVNYHFTRWREMYNVKLGPPATLEQHKLMIYRYVLSDKYPALINVRH